MSKKENQNEELQNEILDSVSDTSSEITKKTISDETTVSEKQTKMSESKTANISDLKRPVYAAGSFPKPVPTDDSEMFRPMSSVSKQDDDPSFVEPASADKEDENVSSKIEELLFSTTPEKSLVEEKPATSKRKPKKEDSLVAFDDTSALSEEIEQAIEEEMSKKVILEEKPVGAKTPLIDVAEEAPKKQKRSRKKAKAKKEPVKKVRSEKETTFEPVTFEEILKENNKDTKEAPVVEAFVLPDLDSVADVFVPQTEEEQKPIKKKEIEVAVSTEEEKGAEKAVPAEVEVNSKTKNAKTLDKIEDSPKESENMVLSEIDTKQKNTDGSKEGADKIQEKSDSAKKSGNTSREEKALAFAPPLEKAEASEVQVDAPNAEAPVEKAVSNELNDVASIAEPKNIVHPAFAETPLEDTPQAADSNIKVEKTEAEKPLVEKEEALIPEEISVEETDVIPEISEDAYVAFRDVRKTYKVGDIEIHASNGINFEIKKGEFVVVVGASGAGKTTVLNILGGMDSFDSGQVLVDGKDISGYSEKELTLYRRNDIGFVFQFYNLVPNLTALENVELSTQIKKGSLNPKEVLESVGLENRLNNFPAGLSGGEQQRVSIARALAKKPKLLLCDEPTGALDSESGKNVLELLRKTSKETETTVIVITHNRSIIPTADRVIEINNGKVRSMGVNDHPVAISEIEW